MDKREDDLIHEVEEQLKWEKIEKIAKDYGSYIAGGVLAVILAVAGYEYWGYSSLQSREAQSEIYSKGAELIATDKTQQALEVFKSIEDNGDAYAMMARFASASALAEKPETLPQAIEAYKAIVNDKSIDRRYRTLGIIYLVMAELDTAEPDELSKLLEEASIGGNMWPEMTTELKALVAMRKGDMDSARKFLTELKDSKDTSRTTNLRARALLDQLELSAK